MGQDFELSCDVVRTGQDLLVRRNFARWEEINGIATEVGQLLVVAGTGVIVLNDNKHGPFGLMGEDRKDERFGRIGQTDEI